MAQRKEQYENFADSIFKFIFASNKKNDPLPQPRNIPGVSGDEMAYALGEIAASPAMYVSEETLNVINEPINNIKLAKLAEVNLEAGQPSLKTEINLNNLTNFLTNPEGFLDDVFAGRDGQKRAARKLNMIRGLGGVLDLGIGAVAMRSAGLSTVDSLEMGSILGNERWNAENRNMKAEELATRASALEAARARNLDYNQANKQAQIFTSIMESSRFDLQNLDITKIHAKENFHAKKQIVNKFKHHGITDENQINDILDRYADRAKNYKNQEGYNWNVGDLNKNITKRHSEGLDFNNPNEWINSENPADKIRALKYEELKAEIALLPNNDEKVKKVKQLKQIETWQLSNGGNMKWSAKFGEMSLNAQSLNQLVLQGGGFSALISGGLFDARKNNLTPSEGKKVVFKTSFDEDEKELPTHEILVARDDMNRRYTSLNNFYYFTPASIGKTLFVNGEGFAYRAYLNQEKIRDTIKGSDSLYKYVRDSGGSIKDEPLSGILGEVDINNQDAVLKRLSEGDNYLHLLKTLEDEKNNINNPELLKEFARMEKLNNKTKNSIGLKYANWIGDKSGKVVHVAKKPGELISKGIGLGLVKVFGKKTGEKLKGFFSGSKVSLKKVSRALAKKAVHALAQTFGFATTGGLANVLIYAATEVIYFVSEKMLKPVFKIFAFFAWSIGMILLIMLIGVISAFNAINPFSTLSREFDTASKAPPTECVECAPDDDWDGIDRDRRRGGGRSSPDDPSEPDSGEPEIPGDGSLPDFACYNGFPHYGQNDPTWSSFPYVGYRGGGTIGSSGCGPTAAAMVLASYRVTNNEGYLINPVDVARFALNRGHRVMGQRGTSANLFPDVAGYYGLNHRHVSKNEALQSARNGQPVILLGNYPPVHRWPGRNGGHYVVLVGADASRVYICDPQIESGTGNKGRSVPVNVFLNSNNRGAYLIY